MKFLSKLYRFSSSWTGTIIIVLFLIFFVVQSFVIPSGSMKRTLHVGDFLFAKKFSYGIPLPMLPWVQTTLIPDFNDNGHLIEGDKPKREDIVIFLFPKDEKTDSRNFQPTALMNFKLDRSKINIYLFFIRLLVFLILFFILISINNTGWTGIEPAASGVTSRRYNQLNYHPFKQISDKH